MSGDYTWSFETSIVAGRRPKEHYQIPADLIVAENPNPPPAASAPPATARAVPQTTHE